MSSIPGCGIKWKVRNHIYAICGAKNGYLFVILLSGEATAVSKTAAAPIELVKLLVQNRSEMIKHTPASLTARTFRNEGILPFWRGNLPNDLSHFPLNFAFKDSIKAVFKTPKDAPQYKKFAMNITSGGIAGSLSLMFVYSLDYCRTRWVSPDSFILK